MKIFKIFVGKSTYCFATEANIFYETDGIG